MKQTDSEPIRKEGQIFALFLASLGLLSLLSLFLINGWILRLFSEDGVLAYETTANIHRAQGAIVIFALFWILLGFYSYKKNLFRTLDSSRRLLNGLLAVVMFFWLLGMAELILRIRPLKDSVSTQIAYEPSSFSRHKMATYPQNVFYRDGSNWLTIRQGYRGPAFPMKKPKGEIRIVFIGGSFVFNADAPVDKDWPRRVERILQEKGYNRVRVINAGIPAHCSADCLGRLYSEIHLMKPDYVALCAAWNDIKYFHKLTPTESLLQETKPLCAPTLVQNQAPPLAERFQLWLRLEPFFHKQSKETEGILPGGGIAERYGPAGPEQYRLNLRIFVDICRDMGAQPILMTQPRLPVPDLSEDQRLKIRYEYVLLNHEALCRAFEQCDRILHEVVKEKEVPFLDVAPSLSGKGELFKDHIHLNDPGSMEMAKLTAVFFEEELAKREAIKAPLSMK